MTPDEQYMHRCIELAKLGSGYVAPNPMVGAVLVCNEKIIGEGYHQQYGQAHAEVNCINSVKEEDKPLIPHSTLYVSLEPCAHYGKTPPCANLIIEKKIPKVVVGCKDPFTAVNGKGINKLLATGITVVEDILEKECKALNKRFFTFQLHNRPYIILKWAQTANAKIAVTSTGSFLNLIRLFITNELTNRLVHKWRSEEAAILVGTNTALADNPELTNRLWSGKNPVRLVVDMDLKLPSTLKIFNNNSPAIVFNSIKHSENWQNFSMPLKKGETKFYQVTKDVNLLHQVLHACYHLNIQSLLVEGGAKLLQSFIGEGLWNEARIITNETLYVQNGLPAPELSDYEFIAAQKIFSDAIKYYEHL